VTGSPASSRCTAATTLPPFHVHSITGNRRRPRTSRRDNASAPTNTSTARRHTGMALAEDCRSGSPSTSIASGDGVVRSRKATTTPPDASDSTVPRRLRSWPRRCRACRATRLAMTLRYVRRLRAGRGGAALHLDSSAFKQLLYRAGAAPDRVPALTAGCFRSRLGPSCASRCEWRWSPGNSFSASRLRTLLHPALELGAPCFVSPRWE